MRRRCNGKTVGLSRLCSGRGGFFFEELEEGEIDEGVIRLSDRVLEGGQEKDGMERANDDAVARPAPLRHVWPGTQALTKVPKTRTIDYAALYKKGQELHKKA